ncbi:MAG: cupin domain-containing protein [Rhodocyclaceae bacterium]
MNTPSPARLLKLTAEPDGAPEIDHPRPERLLTGNPQRRTWNAVDAALAAGGRVYAGIWQCDPGRWRIAMGAGEHELFTVLYGRCRVHASDGSHQEAGPGEAIYIPPDFEGEFEVLERMSKSYMIIE